MSKRGGHAFRRLVGVLAAACIAGLVPVPSALAAFGFGPRANHATGDLPWSVAVGDLNGDTQPDLAVANASSGNVSVLRNVSTPVVIAPLGLAYGDQPVGTASPSRPVEITNVGDATLRISAATFTGNDADAFLKRSDECSGVLVHVNQSCVIQVRFAPVADGEASAALRIESNAPSSPDPVALAGDATPAQAGSPGPPGPAGPPGPQGAQERRRARRRGRRPTGTCGLAAERPEPR
jgi:hypothetical protein